MEKINIKKLSEFELKILDFFKKNKINKKEKILISVSGGCDSLALLFSAVRIGYEVVAFHLNHNLREESKFEEKYLKDLFQFHKIKSEFSHWDGHFKNNLEEEARDMRYKLLFEVAGSKNIKYIALGHHANDQIETFFMNLSRGSSIDGLSCMKETFKNNDFVIIRPLLSSFKNECKNYLKLINVNWVEDLSNYDIKFKRNKIRNILSKIEDKKLINTRIHNSIKTFQDVRLILDKNFERIFKKIVKIEENFIKVNLVLFRKKTGYEKNQILNKCIQILSKYKEKKIRKEKVDNIIIAIENKKPLKRTIKNLLIASENSKELILTILP